MDDSCAVCADTLEWVAYGPCGHREVCSTCVARLRFICDDRRCCICKTESNVIFVTKALGDYTRMINDFSVLPTEVKEGRVGSYWFHEDTQAYFDDVDHYKMIKAMCRLSCSVCDKMEEQPNGGSRRRAKFRSVEQLKGHLFHQHRQLMCSLCLEGRKVFICEQKLYTRTQLNQHVNTGDSEVDGTESERGGFMGHPMCEFCRTPFYGDNELYSHMSTEHYTCHICQRQNPGQFEYYKNYDDLEIHFRRDHFLCEDESCLAKKFVVFQSEAEMKRHNTLEHGGRMPRYKRNAALQIPTSFRYHRSSEQENRRGRGRGRTFHRDSADDTQLSLAIEASLETANTRHYNDPSISGHVSDRAETSDIGPIIQPFESLDVTDSELPSRYREALSLSSRNTPIQESFFPPLSMSSGSSSSTSQQKEGLPKNTMAERLRRKNQKNVTVLNSAQAWPAAAGVQRPVQPPAINPAHFRPLTNSPVQIKQPLTETRPPPPPPSYSNFLQVRPASAAGSSSSSRSVGSTGRTSPQNASFNPPLSDFPPVSASGRIVPKVEDVQTANKSLVERMRTALEFDEIKYSTFKDISGQYRQGQIDTETYYVCVEEFGLSHLVPELARLCPDAQKQKELIQTHNARSLSNGPNENGGGSSISSHSSVVWKVGNGSKKGKGKSSLNAESSIPKDNSADSFLSTIKKLQSSLNDVSGEEVEVLRKDGYRSAKGKSKVMIDDSPVELSSNDPSLKLKGPIESQSSADGDGRGKQKKKTSKFHRVRLGDGSIASVLDLKNSDRVPEPDPDLRESALEKNPNEGLPARGVWRNSGGQRLLGNAPKEPRK